MNRELRKIKLPISGCTALIITFWSWGEQQELARALLGDTSIPAGSTAEDIKAVMGNIKADKGIDLQKKTLELAIKELCDPAGQAIDKKEVLDLPPKDVELIFAELQKLDEQKKTA
jgi:hypothetical protein